MIATAEVSVEATGAATSVGIAVATAWTGNAWTGNVYVVETHQHVPLQGEGRQNLAAAGCGLSSFAGVPDVHCEMSCGAALTENGSYETGSFSGVTVILFSGAAEELHFVSLFVTRSGCCPK